MSYFLIYIALLALFLIGNKRWGDRMARMDAEQQQALQRMQKATQRHN